MTWANKLVERIFNWQNSITAQISPRFAQWIRCSTPLGHFHKWYLGDGPNCFWCKTCRRWPVLQKVIPYMEDGDWHDRERNGLA